jgi:hypothetical protein
LSKVHWYSKDPSTRLDLPLFKSMQTVQITSFSWIPCKLGRKLGLDHRMRPHDETMTTYSIMDMMVSTRVHDWMIIMDCYSCKSLQCCRSTCCNGKFNYCTTLMSLVADPIESSLNPVVFVTAGYDHTIRFWDPLNGICSHVTQYPDSVPLIV